MSARFTYKHIIDKKSDDSFDLYECLTETTKFSTPDYLNEKQHVLLEIVAKSWEPSIGKGIKNILDRMDDKKKPQTSPRSVLMRKNDLLIQKMYQIFVISSEINAVRSRNCSQEFYNGMQLMPTLDFFLLTKDPYWDPRIILHAQYYKPLYKFPFMREMKGRFDVGDNSVITAISNGQCRLENAKSSVLYDSELAFEIAEQYHTTDHLVLNKIVRFGEDDWNLMIAHAVAALFICPICSQRILYQWSKLHFQQERDCQRWSEKLHVALSSVNEPIGRKFLARHIQSSCEELFINPSSWFIDANEDVKQFFDISTLENCQFPYKKMFGSLTKPQPQENIIEKTDELFHEDKSLNDDAYARPNTKSLVNGDISDYIYLTDCDSSMNVSNAIVPPTLLTQDKSEQKPNCSSISTFNTSESSGCSTNDFSPHAYLEIVNGQKILVDLKLSQTVKLAADDKMNDVHRQLIGENVELVRKAYNELVDHLNTLYTS